MKKLQKGFTLIELLVVIGILAILLAITLIAINPAKQFASANDTKRSSDVNSILNAISQYQTDNTGQLPSGIPTGTPAPIASGAGNADLCSVLSPKYIAALPQDPNSNNGANITNCTSYNTGYSVVQSGSNGRVTVSATGSTGPISVTR